MHVSRVLTLAVVAAPLALLLAVVPSPRDAPALAFVAPPIVAPPSPVINPGSTVSFTDPMTGTTRSTIMTTRLPGVAGAVIGMLNTVSPAMENTGIRFSPSIQLDGFEQHCIDSLNPELTFNNQEYVFPWCLGVYNTFGGLDALQMMMDVDAVDAIGGVSAAYVFGPQFCVAQASTFCLRIAGGSLTLGGYSSAYCGLVTRDGLAVASQSGSSPSLSRQYFDASGAPISVTVIGNTGVDRDSCRTALGVAPGTSVEMFVTAGGVQLGGYCLRFGTQPGTCVGAVAPSTVTPSGVLESQGSMTATVRCSDGTTTQDVTVVTNLTIAPNAPVTIPETKCPEGWLSTGVGLDWAPSTGTPTELVPLAPRELTPVEEDMMNTQPGCLTGASVCTLGLMRLVNGTWQYCGEYGQLCPDWVLDPTVTSNYQCRYGTQILDLNYCSAFRAPDLGILPNMNPDGTLIPYTAPKPTLSPGLSAPGSDDPRANCAAMKPPSFFEALTPRWVFEVVKCALVEVFVPRETVLASQRTAIMTTWQASKLGQVALAVVPAAGMIPSDGCAGLPVDMSWIPLADVGTFYLLPACPGQFFAPIAPVFKVLLSVTLVVGGLFGASRHIGALVNYGGLSGDR